MQSIFGERKRGFTNTADVVSAGAARKYVFQNFTSLSCIYVIYTFQSSKVPKVIICTTRRALAIHTYNKIMR